jgi:hypothetical protein
VCAVLAARDVAAERRGAAPLDRRHDLQLLEAHVTGVGLAPLRSVLAEDVRDLQRWTRHRRRGSGGRLATPLGLGLGPGRGPLPRFGWSLALCLSGWLGLSAGGGFLRRLVDLGVVTNVCRPRDQILERAGDLLNNLGGHPGVDGSCVQFGMTKQRLDHPNVDFALAMSNRRRVSRRRTAVPSSWR